MTTRIRTLILILVLAAVAFTLCACDELDGTGDARREWNRNVTGRQRGIERPTVTPPVEVAERTK